MDIAYLIGCINTPRENAESHHKEESRLNNTYSKHKREIDETKKKKQHRLYR